MPVDEVAVVTDNTRLSDDCNVLALAAPGVAAAAAPGQFVMLRAREAFDPLLRRPFSIFEILRDGNGRVSGITILNKRVGVVTALLHDARPGDRIAVLGPLGRPFAPPSPPATAWLVAGGVGLAPFVTLADALLAQGIEPTLFYGARRAADLHCVDRFERRGVQVKLATEDGSRGQRGPVTDVLAEALQVRAPHREPLHLYACGPTPMMRAVADLATRAGCRCDVSLEPVMGCGLGGCYSCVVPVLDEGGRTHHVRSCLEGPVFDSRRLDWNALRH